EFSFLSGLENPQTQNDSYGRDSPHRSHRRCEQNHPSQPWRPEQLDKPCQASRPLRNPRCQHKERIVSWAVSLFIQKLLDFHRLLTDSVSFVPMEFHSAQGSIRHSHHRNPLQFTPTSASIHFAKMRLYSNTRPRSDDLNV